MNLKKILLGSLAVVAAVVSLAPTTNAALNDAEFTSALNWAYENGLTKFNTEDAFNPYANITREQAAKFLASYTVTNLCEVASDEGAMCDFSDANSGDASLKEYIMLACELGLVKGSGGKFNPTADLTRAEAFTILSRAMSANAGEDAPAEDGTPWYAGHFKAMQDAGLTKETNVEAQTRPITRYELLLVLYRSKMDDAECSDTDVDDLLDELFGDDTTTDDEDTTEEVVTESNGVAMVKLSSATPNGSTLPQGVSAKVASFDVTASDEDVIIQSIDLKRLGLGDDDVISKLTLFANGDVVTKSKSENSENMFTFVLNPAVTVKKGTTVTIDAVAQVNVNPLLNSSLYNNDEFALSLVGFGTNGKESTTNLPIVANTFRVGGVAGANITVKPGTSLPDVNLGAKDADVMKFDLQNTSSNDVEITKITIEDEEKNADENLANLKLLHKGVVVATTAKANGKYVTFVLAKPVMIEDGKTEKFSVTADVIAGAGEKVMFSLDQAIYLEGKDLQYNNSIAATATYAGQDVVILAGEVTLSENALLSDKVRADKDNVVLASANLIAKAGQNLSLEDIEFMFKSTTGTINSNIFENIELQVTINGSVRTFDLTKSGTTFGTAGGVSVSDNDLGIAIPAGSTVKLELIADMANTLTVSPEVAKSFYVNLSTTSNFEIIETSDDEKVTDITPSSITFDTIDIVNPIIKVTKLFTANVDVVRGTTLVDAYAFEVKTDSISPATINDITFYGQITSGCAAVSGGNLTKDVVTQFSLHKATGSGYTLVKSESASKLSAGTITFTNLNQTIPVSTTQKYLLTVDIAGSDDLNGCTFDIDFTAQDIDDDESFDLIPSPATPNAVYNNGRNITVKAAGTLAVSTVTNNDSKVSADKHVLGNTTSDYVARFEITSTNEDMDLIDLNIVASGDVLQDNVTDVVLFNEAGTELARKSVSSNTVSFEDLTNVIAKQGTTVLYAKVITRGIGLNQGTNTTLSNTQLKLDIIEAKGISSGKKIVNALSASYSKLFDVIPAKISNIEFVPSYAGTNVITSFGNAGVNNANIAILKVTTDNWTNLKTDGTNLDIVLDTIQFTLPAYVTSGTIERLGNGTVTPINLVSGLATFPAADSNSIISKSSTAYYLIKGSIASGSASFSPEIKDLDAGGFVYETTDAVYGSVTSMLIGKSFINTNLSNTSN